MESKLFEAVEQDSLESIRNLLSQGAKIDAKNADGNTPLHMAVMKQNKEVVQFLIDSGADLSAFNNNKETPLNLAFGYTKILKVWSSSDEVPLDFSDIIFGRVDESWKSEIMKILINAGADVNYISPNKDNHGKTALHYACETGDADLVRLIVGKGVDVNLKDDSNLWAPLHFAAHNIYSEDPAIFEILLSAGADPNITSLSMETPLHILSGCRRGGSPRDPSISLVEIVKVFSKYNADFYLESDKIMKAMDFAIYFGHGKAVEALILSGGVDVNSTVMPPGSEMSIGETLLMRAVYNGDLTTVKFLLEHGADINALDEDNGSALQRAIIEINLAFKSSRNEMKEKMELLEYLLEWYPDVNTIPCKESDVMDDTFENYFKCSPKKQFVIGENILILKNRKNKKCKLPTILVKTIVQHLAKLQAIDQPVPESLLETISKNTPYEQHFQKCKQELQVAENTLINSRTTVTLFNLLVNDYHKLFEYIGDKELAKDLIKKNFKKILPIYGPVIKKRITEAEQIYSTWADQQKLKQAEIASNTT